MSDAVLVLGASGYIGGHIALAAVAQGRQVRGLRRSPDSTGHLGSAPVRWFQGDIDQPDSLEPVLRNVGLLFHAAAYYPQDSRPVAGHVAHSVRQMRGVLAAAQAAGVRRVVFTSSLSTIGRPPAGSGRLADEQDHYLPGSLPGSAYYECKYAMESEALRACAAGQDVVIVNPTLVLGPGDIHLAVGRIIVPLARGWGLVWLPGSVNAIDVRDAAQAHLAAAERGAAGERYILGGHNLMVRELENLIADRAGVRRPVLGVSERTIQRLAWLLARLPGLRLYSNHLIGLSHWQGYDTRKAEGVLGLAARPLVATIDDMLASYRRAGRL